MNAYMTKATARALLAMSRTFTERKRQEREARQRKEAAQRAAFEQFARIGFGHTAAQELAAIYVESEKQ